RSAKSFTSNAPCMRGRSMSWRAARSVPAGRPCRSGGRKTSICVNYCVRNKNDDEWKWGAPVGLARHCTELRARKYFTKRSVCIDYVAITRIIYDVVLGSGHGVAAVSPAEVNMLKTAKEIPVEPDTFRVARQAVLIAELCASLAVCLFDDTQGVGGLLH